MPVEVTKYTCQFRCGKKAVGDRGTMAAHESNCWKNVENKTCKTCSNQVYEMDNDEYYGKAFYRGCKIKEIANIFEADSIREIMAHQNAFHVRPVYHCPYWNKQGDENVESFAEKLFNEISGDQEGTTHYPFYNKPEKKKDNRTAPIDNLPF